MTRIIPFETIRNFRDFGDYPTKDGRTVTKGKLFRSAHLSDLNDDELPKFRDIEIGLIVDLRHKPERDRQPNVLPEDQDIITLAYPDPKGGESEAVAPHEAFMREALMTSEDARNYMNKSYKARPDDEGFRAIFSDTLKHMAKTGDNILVHCAAGKDRTGTLVAVIHGILGVDADTIMEDYMLTMKAVDVESFLEPAAKFIGSRFGRTYDPNALRPMFGVEEGYLENALTTIGDMDTYIHNSLGITSKERDAICAHYTV